jgi:hypothetical protein
MPRVPIRISESGSAALITGPDHGDDLLRAASDRGPAHAEVPNHAPRGEASIGKTLPQMGGERQPLIGTARSDVDQDVHAVWWSVVDQIGPRR